MAVLTPAWLLLALFLAPSLPSTSAQLRLCAKPGQESDCTSLHIATKDFHCIPVDSSIDCLYKLRTGAADFGVFGAEEAVLAAELLEQGTRFGIVGEVRNKERQNDPYAFETVVLVRSSVNGGIAGLAGKGYCHPGFSKTKLWTDPVVKALERAVLKDKIGCSKNKTTLETEISGLDDFFGPSCRPGAWTSNSYVDKKLKQKYTKMCALCEHKETCSYRTDTVGTQVNALNCLKLEGGDIAYTSLSAAQKYFDKPLNFKYLCKDGTNEALSQTHPCTWVKQPWPLVVTAPTIGNTVSGKLKDLFAQDSMVSQKLKHLLAGLSDVVNLTNSAQLPTLREYIAQARDVAKTEQFDCERQIRWCTTNDVDRTKCQYLATAARTHGITPYIECPVPEKNSTQCLNSIKNSNADITVINTNEGFIARDLYNLTPVAYVEGEPFGYYYHGVMVVNEASNVYSLADLKGKRACFPSFNGLGWLNYIKTGIDGNLFPKSACAASSSVTSFFSSACAPGAMDPNVNDDKVCDNVCSACTNGGNCNYDNTNPFFGEEGALKCLLSGAGDVAFLDYNVFARYVDTNNTLRNLRILCKNGVKSNISSIDIEGCANTQVISHEIVAHRGNRALTREIQHVFEQLNDWFGNKLAVINLFGSFQNHSNVIFPKEGIDLINVYSAQGPYTNDYKDLLTQLKHCNGCGQIRAAIGVLLLGIFVFWF